MPKPIYYKMNSSIEFNDGADMHYIKKKQGDKKDSHYQARS